MSIGAKRARVAIEQDQSAAQDQAGGSIEDWQVIALRWAKINPGRGREFESAKAQHSELTHVLTLRFERLIDNAWRQSHIRIQYGTRIFKVLTCVNKDERDKELLIYCKELIQ